MTPEQIEAVRKLWDALSDILEDVELSELHGFRKGSELRQQALAAIELALVAFPSEHIVQLDTEPTEPA